MTDITSNSPNNMLAIQNQNTLDQPTGKFWNFIEKNMGCVIPKYLKNILKLCGFDNAQSIKTLTDSDFSHLVTFAKVKMNKFIPVGSDPQDYYHIFSKNPEDFEILFGHVRLLEQLVKYINLMTELHGLSFF